MSYNLPTMANVSSSLTKHRRTTNDWIHPEAEILNARLAMLGFIIAVELFTTGQIIPGVW